MIVRSFELTKLNLNDYNFYLFYGENEGLKDEVFSKLLIKYNKENLFSYYEQDVLNNLDNKFELNQYEKLLENQLIEKAVDEVISYLINTQ